MKILHIALIIALLAGNGFAQRHKLAAVNSESPDGKLIQQSLQENDPAKKLGILEQYIAQFADKQETTGWVLSQLQPLYTKAGNYDKAIQTGEKLLALDADDIDAAYGNLKAAEAKKDVDAILKWSAQTSLIAKKIVKASKREGDDAEEWKQAVDYAKQVDTYTEYALYLAALQSTDPRKVILLTETLEQRNPDSPYIAQLMERYAASARQANALPKAIEFGERAFGRNQFNGDMLLAMSDAYMQQKQLDKALKYSTKAVELMSSQPKPEGVPDADWEKKKASIIGLGNWMTGVTLSSQNKYAPADKALRSALPYIKDSDQLMAGALFHLGLVNYKMGQTSKSKTQIADAIKFSEQSGAIKSPFQAQAQKNVKVIKTEFKIN
jgi:tetratricopeptide (TPR) repeat protein